jgi:predicted nuclease of predicted toxin-antitoxin system
VARLYADEQYPFPVVEFLRALGHDVLTVQEAGKAGLKIPDDEVLAFATSQGRAVLTLNRYDFKQLHLIQPDHAGIINCVTGVIFIDLMGLTILIEVEANDTWTTETPMIPRCN